MNDIQNMVTSPDCSLKEVCYMDSLLNNLNRRKLRAEAELANVTAALDALAKNPEVANVLELISKAGR